MTIDDATSSVDVRTGYRYDQDEAFAVDPFARWLELREEHGRAFMSDTMPDWNVWYLLHYEDIKSAFQDPQVFSSKSVSPHAPLGAVTMIPEMLDPPEHGKYRHLLVSWFSPAAVAARADEIRALCVELIEQLAPAGSCDLDRDFARVFPTTIFLRWMGLDEDQVTRLVEEAYGMYQGGMRRTAGNPVGGEMSFVMKHLQELVADRRANRRDDLVSHLLASEVDGHLLGEDEVFPILVLLYAAGLDTVAGELCYAFATLAERPDLQELLVARPEVIPSFVEEVLRMHGLAATARLVTEDVEFAGCPMKAGDRLVLPTAIANFDETVFDEPLTFVADREANRHLTFAAGPHRCLGSHLARQEMIIALEEWHERITSYRLQDGAKDTLRHKLGSVTGLLSLPLEWDAVVGGTLSRSPVGGGGTYRYRFVGEALTDLL